jgi:hypothetical protein
VSYRGLNVIFFGKMIKLQKKTPAKAVSSNVF